MHSLSTSRLTGRRLEAARWRLSPAKGQAMNRSTLTLGGLLTVLLVTTADASPAAGARRPEVRLVDAWERAFELKTLQGTPVLFVYEDKESAMQNKLLKAELAELAKGDRYKRSIAIVAIADVTGYDFWPVRGFVKRAIRDESVKFGTVIYCDWQGEARGALGASRGMSNVALYGKDGALVFAHAGTMPKAKREELVALLRVQVGG